jgi:hypothetical protein
MIAESAERQHRMTRSANTIWTLITYKSTMGSF